MGHNEFSVTSIAQCRTYQKNIKALLQAQMSGFVNANRNKLKKDFFFEVNKKWKRV